MREPLPNRSDDAALDRAWDATRPVEPSDATWNALWARVSDRLDRAEGGVTPPLTLAPRHRSLTPARLAMAATLLAAVTVAVATARRPAVGPADAPAVANSTPAGANAGAADIDIEAGEVALLDFDGGEVEKSVIESGADSPLAFDPTIAIYGRLETLARND